MTAVTSALNARVEEQRITVVQRLLWVLLAIACAALLLLLASSGGNAFANPAFIVNLLVIPVIAVALWLIQRDRFEIAVVVVMTILLLAGAAPILLGGLNANPLSILIFAVPIVLAGQVLGRRALALVTAVGVGSIVISSVLEAAGVLPGGGGSNDPDWYLAVQSVVLLLLIGYFLDRFGLVFRATLTDALDSQVKLKDQAHERLHDQEALLDEQRFTEAVVENLPGIFALLSQDGKFTSWNRNFERVLGYSDDVVREVGPEQVVAEEDRESVLQFVRQVFDHGSGTSELTLQAADGRKIPYLLTGARITLDRKDYLAGVALDRSELTAARSRIDDLDEELSERLERITALHEIDRAITGSMDLKLTLDVVLQQVTRRLHVDAAAILLLRPDSHTLVFGAARGFRGRTLQRTSLRLGEGLAGQAALERKRVVIDDADELSKAFTGAELIQEEGFVGYVAAPLVAKGQLQGVLEIYHRSQLDTSDDWHSFLTTLATQAAIALDNSKMLENLERSNTELKLAYDRTIEGWARALDLKDEETEGHSRRVTDLAVTLAERMGMRPEELVHLRRGALLHDIGKMGIPDSILLKPAALDPEEWEVMRRHPVYAVDLLSPIDFLRPALDIPYCHHEKWDGSGYPLGVAAEQIPLAARIFAVVDVWDALTSTRPYRPAWPTERALAYIKEQRGKQFDPAVVDEFMELRAAD